MTTPSTRTQPLVLLLWLLLCGFAWLLPGSARAAIDEKTYPATSCRRMDDSAGALGTRPNGTIENDHPSFPLTVICPIVRDNTQTTGIWSARVSVVDANDTNSSVGKVVCTAESVNKFGALHATSTAQTSQVGTGRSTLVLSPATQVVEGYSAIKCTLPPSDTLGRSRLVAYQVNEPSSGDSETDSKTYTGTYVELATAAAGAFPHIDYTDFGLAKPDVMAAADEWVLPLIRDRHDKLWDRARFRFNDSDADQVVECWIGNYNEDGTVEGFLSFGSQGGVAPGQSTTQVNANPMAGLNDGPLAMYCESIAIDVLAAMYDFRETDDP